MNKWLLVFLLAFGLNAAWEFWHSRFYVHYQNGPITKAILLRAALFDGAVITLALYLAQQFFDAGQIWWAAGGLLVFAILLEKWALATARWQYADTMPLIPLLSTGLTPTIQLAVTGAIAYLLYRYVI